MKCETCKGEKSIGRSVDSLRVCPNCFGSGFEKGHCSEQFEMKFIDVVLKRERLTKPQ